MRLIDADALLKKKRETMFFACNIVSECDIDEAPTIEAVPVRRGEWEYKAESGITKSHWRCSNCGHPFLEHYADSFKYCPHCGAKMDGDTP